MKRYIVFLVLTFLLFNLSAQEISFDEARQKAQEFFFATDKTPQTLKSASVVKVDTFATFYTKIENQLKSAGQKEEPAFFIFNRTDKPGFVILSADKRIRDVIAYSNTGVFTNPNPGLKALLNQYAEEISYAKEYNINANTILYDYNAIEEGDFLLGEIEWNQGPDPYNSDCPQDPSSTAGNGRVWAGCVATAIAQIMYYHKYPRFGKGYHINKYDTYGQLSVDFSIAENRFEFMVDQPKLVKPLSNLNKIAISNFLFNCGIAVDMEYKPDGSESYITDAKKALEDHFNYKKCFLRDKDNYELDEWKQLIKDEILIYERPIYYRAKDTNGKGAHAFVLDGYRSDDTYHMNWGWDGDNNEFYPLNLLNIPDLDPYGNIEYDESGNPKIKYEFNIQHIMLTGIEPANPDNTPPKVIGSVVHTNDLNTDIIFTFSEPIKESRIIFNHIIVYGERSGFHGFPLLPDCYNASTRKLTINPYNDFQPAEKVYITLKSGLSDLVGNNLDGDNNGTEWPDYHYEFTTTGFSLDYAVKSVSVSNKSPKLGEKIIVSAVIQNVGKEQGTSEQTITLYDNNAVVKSFTMFTSVAIGGEITQEFEWTSTIGYHELNVEIVRAGDENPLNNAKHIYAFPINFGNFIVDGDQNQEIDVTVSPGKINNFMCQLQLNSQTNNLKSSQPNSAKMQNTTTAESITTISTSGQKSSWVLLTDGTSVSLTEGDEKQYNFDVIAPAGTSPGAYNAVIDFTSADSTKTSKINLLINVIEQTTGFAAYEYWFDDEYESKKRKEINSQNILELNTNIPATGLEEGLHSFHFRVLDNNGQWSTVTSRFFNKLPLSGALSKIIAYEYWFDNDFNSKESEFIRGRQIVSLDDDIDINSLQFGLHSYHIRFLDNTMSWSPVSSQFFLKLPALPEGNRIITVCEYWFDDNFANKVSTEITPGQTITTNTGFDVSTLQTGLHSYHVRYKDDAGRWSSVVSEFFHKLPVLPEGDRVITACEYWFDDDFANKISTEITPGQTITTNEEFDVSTLQTGLHSYHLRYKDDAGQWSSVVSEFFHKLPVTAAGTREITACEYWFDDDFANKVSMEITPGQTITTKSGFDVSALQTGLHSYHVRYKDDAGQWSSVVSEFFHKLPALPEGDRKITICEYWFDDDFASKVSAEITPGQTITTNEGFDASSLTNGLHSYHVRYKDDAGQWSSVVSEFFHKLPASATGERKITAYEYWYDSDYAGKITVPVTPEQIFSLNGGLDAVALPTGLHSYHVRYKDNAGQWSSVVSEFFHKLPASSAQNNLITAYR